MSKQQDLWSGAFGDFYQERNQLSSEEVTRRAPLWENIAKVIYTNCGVIPNSYLEIGAGQGPNLSAIRKIYMGIEKPVDLWATEINTKARENLKANVDGVHILESINNITQVADCVFTYGVLIHTHPAHLKALMRDIYKASKRFIVCAEYFAPVTRSIQYHGENDALWLDDYGSHWIDNFSLRVIGHGFCWKRMTELDNITFWIFEKMEKMN